MPLINCKVELKLKWTKYCVLSAAGNDNTNADPNNIIFTQKLSKLLSKRFERSVYWNEYKTKRENKNTTNEYRYFLGSHFVGVNSLFVLVYTNHNGYAIRFTARKYYLPKGIISNYNAIINGKNFYDPPVDSGIKRYEKIRKIANLIILVN